LALEVLGNEIGFEVRTIDDNSRNRMVDASGFDRHGRSTAVEVTRLAREHRLEAEHHIYNKSSIAVPKGRLGWMATVGDGFRNRSFERRLTRVAEICENAGIEPFPTWPPGGPSFVEQHKDDIHWYFSQPGLRLRHWRWSKPGEIKLLASGFGGAVAGDTQSLPAWFNNKVNLDHIEGKLSKLEDSGYNRLHLFLHVHAHGAPFEVFYPLAFGPTTPIESLQIPTNITDVWFAPTTYEDPESAILWWSDEFGWKRVSRPRSTG
jgi:hypothetical protein